MLLPDAVDKLLDSMDDDIGMVFGGYVECDKDMKMGDQKTTAI